jgi:response regulator RpfG family c-di-GMP phosphodiesterase
MTEHTAFLMNLTVLVIDVDLSQLEILKDFVDTHGGYCFITDSFAKAIEYVEGHQFDVALCDICLSHSHTGFDFIDQANQIDPELTIILTTGFEPEQYIQTMIKKNIYTFLNKPYQFMSLGLLLLQASRNTRNLRRNKHLAENLRSKIAFIRKERDKIFFNTLTSLTNALEQKDEYTKNHSEMVGELSEKICWEYTDDEYFTEDVAIAGRLHDIGKIGIRDEILFKKEKLTDDEYDLIKKHSEMSYKIIKPVDVVGKISDYVLHHHERWNGEGYPHKLKEKAIPVGARILAVADTFNALVSNRPYRKAQEVEYALRVLFDGRYVDFDPEIVEILYKIIKTKRLNV